MSNNWNWDTCFLEISRYLRGYVPHFPRRFFHVRFYRGIIVKTFRTEYFGKKMLREKRRISDDGGGYEKHLNEIPLALGCMAWQSDTPPKSNRVIRRLTPLFPEPSSRPAISYDRLPASLADLLITPRAKKEFDKGGRTNECERRSWYKQIFL